MLAVAIRVLLFSVFVCQVDYFDAFCVFLLKDLERIKNQPRRY